MPLCAKCNDRFPAKIRIDGKVRNLGNRKYCLNCSPFGFHNTRKIHESGKEKIARLGLICSLCGKPRGTRRKLCGNCAVRVHRFRLKIAAVSYKGGKCNSCGFAPSSPEEMVVFDFHHRDPSTKKFEVSSTRRSWPDTKKELDKCDLLCANCHRLEHRVEISRLYELAITNYRGSVFLT